MPALRAALYARVSSEEQVEGYSLDAQLRACRDYATTHGWAVAGEYVDEGKSARTDVIAKRPAFRSLLTAVEQRLCDVVIVHKVDRFSRKMIVTLEAFRHFSHANCGFVSILEQFDYTTPQGKLLLHMLAALAEFYGDNLSQEIRKGKAERKSQGLWNGQLPFGCLAGEDGMPVPDRRPQPNGSTNYDALIAMLEMCAEGHSDGRITQWLNDHGYRTDGNRGVNLWKRDAVRHVCVNRLYVGELPLDRRRTAWAPGKHPPIVDVDLFERAQEARQRVHHHSVPLRGHVYSLSGLLRCAYCLESDNPKRGFVRISRKRARIAGTWYHRASCLARETAIPCPCQSVLLDVIEAQVNAWIGRIVPDEAALMAAEHALTARRFEGPDPEIERRRINEQLARNRALYKSLEITQAEYEADRDRWSAQLRALPTHRQSGRELRAAATQLRSVHEAWDNLSPVEQNRLLSTIIQFVVVRDGVVEQIVPQPDFALLLPQV